MSLEDIDRAIYTATSAFPDARITGGVSDEDIAALENIVGTIPTSYRYFLSRYGTIGFQGIEIYGLVNGHLFGEGPPNTFCLTKLDIDRGYIPNHHVIVSSTGYGPVFLLNCRDGRVFGWNYSGFKDDELPCFATFGAFIAHEIDTIVSEIRS